MRKLSILLLVILCGSSLTAKGYAASPPSPKAVTIQPFLQNISLDSSQSQQEISVNVTNNTSSPYTFKPTAIDFGSLDETGGLLFAGNNSISLANKYGLANWIIIDDASITLPPHKSTNVLARIDNRNDLAPGGHYAAIVLQSAQDQKNTSTSNVSFQQNISSLIFVTKNGGEKYDLNLASIHRDGDIFNFPRNITLRFYNPGNVQVIPRGIVKLLHDNKIISQGTINDNSSFVLPETYRKLTVSLIPLYKDNSLMGSYTIKVDYRYDGINKYASKAITFTYVNKVILILALLILILTTKKLLIDNPRIRK